MDAQPGHDVADVIEIEDSASSENLLAFDPFTGWNLEETSPSAALTVSDITESTQLTAHFCDHRSHPS